MDTIVREDCAKAYIGPLTALGSPEKEATLVRLIALFLRKRADIGHAVGMGSLMAFALHIFPSENAAFGIFCYIVERLYPIDYFSKADRQVGRYAEYRTFALLAERLRPRLVQPLKAIFKPQNSSVSPSSDPGIRLFPLRDDFEAHCRVLVLYPIRLFSVPF